MGHAGISFAGDRRAHALINDTLRAARDPDHWLCEWLAGLEWVARCAFRRAVATLLDKEADTKRAASQLGHRTEQVTKKHYIEKPAIAPDSSEILEQLGAGRASTVAKRDGPRQTA